MNQHEIPERRPLLDASGNLVSSGRSFWAFTRAKMTLSGTTLNITTG